MLCTVTPRSHISSQHRHWHTITPYILGTFHSILTGKRGKWGGGLYFFFLAKIWSCRKMPCHQCSASSWAAWFLSPVNKLFCVSSLAAAELMRRILSIELCHRTCWTSCYFHKSLIKKKVSTMVFFPVIILSCAQLISYSDSCKPTCCQKAVMPWRFGDKKNKICISYIRQSTLHSGGGVGSGFMACTF